MQQNKAIWWKIFACFFFLNTAVPSYALGVHFTEKASFNEDRSGKFSLTVDLTQTNKLIKLIQYLYKDYKALTQLIGYKPLCILRETLKSIPDISKPYVQHDPQMVKFTLGFGFKTIEALNAAMHKINLGLDPPGIVYFSMNKELFVREDMNGIVKRLILYQQHDHCLIKSLDLTSFFRQTTYTTLYTFHNKIKNCSNPFSELSKSRKAVRITHHIFVADETEESIGNRLHF